VFNFQFTYLRLFVRVLDNGLCDIRARPCMKTIIFGEYFLDSENLTCHVREFLVSCFPSLVITNAYKLFVDTKA